MPDTVRGDRHPPGGSLRSRTGPARLDHCSGNGSRSGTARSGPRTAILGGAAACRRTILSDVPDGRFLTLTASLRPAALDARRGIVRLHPEVLTALALKPGDPVRLTGRRETAGIVALAETGASRALLYADDLLLGNLVLPAGSPDPVALG